MGMVPWLSPDLVRAESPADHQEGVESIITPEKPKIDGQLDDKAWKNPPIKKDFITFYPIYGEKLPYETRVWVANDNENLYFAFHCLDPEPTKIKTSLTKRDSMFNDDYVGIAVDPEGNGLNGYVLYVNPNGIQGDALISSVGDEDISPDFVWESAAQMTDTGYQVEICLPLTSIRFKSGKKVKMKVLFHRKITRFGYKASWPDIKLNYTMLDSQAQLIVKDIKKQVKFELLPSLTYSDTRERLTPDECTKRDRDPEFGVSLKYGITSSITADITINPDFSQVESDAFQVEVNQRYPLFFSEKRSFFMEGADIFKFYTLPYGFFRIPVHTRRIIDPGWGAKLTGTLGKMSLGILAAGDQWPGQSWSTQTNPDEGKEAFFGIARVKYSLGNNNFVGFLYSGREFAEQYNRVFGIDMAYRIGKDQRASGSFLHSMSMDQQGNKTNDAKSSNYNLNYHFATKIWLLIAALEHIGTEFKMDTAYLLRNGIDNYYFRGGFGIYPKSKWLKMISPDVVFQYTHDLHTDMNDIYLHLANYFFFSKEGGLICKYIYMQEYWEAQTFKLNQVSVKGALRFNKWLKIGGEYSYGDRIYYEGNPPLKGQGNVGTLYLDLQPSEKFNQYFSFTHSDLSYQNQEIYDVDILYSKTTYQFNKYFFLRAVVQYNSFLERLMTDLLASFTLIPGTVLHMGYGGLYENRNWINNQWIYREGDMLNTKRSFFAKVSYLWRF